MKLTRLICLDFNGNELEPEIWQQFDYLCEQRSNVNSSYLSSLADKLSVEGLLVKLGAKVGQDIIELFPNLKYIGMLGTGYGGIDTTYAAKRGITVTNIANYATQAVTDFTFAILLERLRSVCQAKNQAAQGDYSDNFSGSEIRDKKFAVIGLGNIGQRTALLAQAFGADVCYWSKHRKLDIEHQGVKYCPLNKLLTQADFITLNLALNTETIGVINAGRLKSLKPGVIIINPSPMELLDFPALLKQLKRANMTFILDHSDEMTAQQLKALKSLQNCLIYPPIAYLTAEASQLKKQIYLANLKNFLNGAPTNKVS